jgi:UDP-perosamine 4-acetyltransferase
VSTPLVLLGGGGHAKVLIELLHSLGEPLLGLVDPNVALGESVLEVASLGDDSVLALYKPFDIELVNGLGSLPFDQRLRQQLFNQFTALGFHFKTLQHPSALVSPSVQLAMGVQIMARAMIQTASRIGENSIINSGAIIEHDCVIGAQVHIAPGAVLSGGVQVEDGVHIGTGAVVIQGIHIGAGSIIGAGSVITRDVAPRHIVYPARVQQQPLPRDLS